jgi:HK97 family phage prohead protease
MKITVPIKITAADSESRTISGRIVTFDEPANTSAGRTIFAKGSVVPTDVKLNLEHDRTRPIGKTLSMVEAKDGSGIDAIFKIANTVAGSDALSEAMEGLRDGFSVGVAVDEYDTVDGAMVIKASELIEVSLVTEPAVRSARVSEVAASSGEEETQQNSEGEKPAEETNPTTEGEQVEDTTVQAPAEETVEASRKLEASARPAFYTKPRFDFTPGKYLENTIKASMGDEDARAYVAAAADTTDNAGLVPTRQLSTVINGLATSIRPSIDAISRGTLPDAGMSFEIPKITVLPTVAETAEAGTPSETDQNSAFVTVTVKKYAGQQTFSVELMDRTSPMFYDELVRNLAAQYAAATNAAVSAALVSGATADSTTTTTYPTATELLGFVSRGAASVFNATKGLPVPYATKLIGGTGQWGNIMTLNDSGRPIYMAQNPMNAGGAVSATSLRGNVAGLDFYVDPSLNSGDADGTLIMVNPDAYTWYEGSTYQLRADVIASGQISLVFYGYGAIATKIAAGAFKNNKA